MEGEKVLRKFNKLTLAGVSFWVFTPHEGFQQNQHTRWVFLTLGGQRKYKWLCHLLCSENYRR